MPATEHLDQTAPSKTLPRARIPNLDLGPLFGDDPTARVLLTDKVRRACQDPGFFYVHNSGVDNRMIRAALDAMREFFDIADDNPVKRAVHNANAGGMKGWGPMFGEPAYQKDTVAHVESFDIGQELGAEAHAAPGIDPNIWPDLPEFRDTVLDYYAEITRLGRALSEVFSEMLGMEPEFINANSGKTAPRTMRLLHYPANNTPADSRNVGIAAHTDFECFTIMNQTAAGLELTDTGGEWCEAPSDIGTFTVILGDMMERFSNGFYKATGHRVVNTPWTRYSIVLFFAVDGAYRVEPLPGFINPANPSRYQAVTQDEHIERELARAAAHSGEALGQMTETGI